MSEQSSVIQSSERALPHKASGLGWGFLGVTAFSFTVPFTRVATHDGLAPLFVGSARAVIAAVLAGAALYVTRQAAPKRGQWRRIALVAGGVVIGFPLMTSYALTTAPASHGAVVIGLLPAATAAAAVLRGGERVPASFWSFSALGACAVIAFAALHNGGLGSLGRTDLLLLGAVVAAAVGYAEGGLLARELGAWQTVSWALVMALPLMVILTIGSISHGAPSARVAGWSAFAYLAVVSMYLGFFAWYRGLSIGPMAQVSQVQLVQPVLSIMWAAVLLDEQLAIQTVAGGAIVIACAGLAVRSRLHNR